MKDDKDNLVEFPRRSQATEVVRAMWKRLDRNGLALRVAVAALFLAAIVLTSFLFHSHYQGAMDRATARATAAELRAKSLEEENARLAEVRLYTELLPIHSLHVRRSNGFIQMSGHIENQGARAVGDVDITAYGLDPQGRPLSIKTFVLKSMDGKPLYRSQRRYFRIELPGSFPSSSVHVMITGIDFQ